MKNKKLRQKLTGTIRSKTGLHIGTAARLARRYLGGGTLLLDLQAAFPTPVGVSFDLVEGGCGCCPRESFLVVGGFTGSRGTFSFEDGLHYRAAYRIQ